jgi:GNAT superfamily N-acetyltransferase
MPRRSGSLFLFSVRRAVAVVVAAGLALYTVEGLLGVDRIQRWRLPSGFDRRTRLEVLADLRQKGVAAIPHPSSHGYLRDRGDGTFVSQFASEGREFLPLGGVRGRTAVVCNENGQYLIVQPDRYGFNNPPSVWEMPSVAVAAVGDSFTYGICVDPAESYIGRIRKAHPATINLGITSNGPLFELATLKEYLPAVKPRLVLWFFFENDIEDIEFERRDALLMRYVREASFTQNLRDRQADIDRLVTQFLADRETKARQQLADDARFTRRTRDFLEATRLRALIRDTRQYMFGEPDAKGLPENDWRLFDEILGEADRTVRSWGGRIHFVYLPTLRRFGVPVGVRLTMLPKDYMDALHTRVLDVARRHGFPITDLTATFMNHPNARRDLFSPIFHYTAEGYRLVADAVLADMPPETTGSVTRPHDDTR